MCVIKSNVQNIVKTVKIRIIVNIENLKKLNKIVEYSQENADSNFMVFFISMISQNSFLQLGLIFDGLEIYPELFWPRFERRVPSDPQ